MGLQSRRQSVEHRFQSHGHQGQGAPFVPLTSSAPSQPMTAVYGHVPADLAEVPAASVQCSPLVPGSSVLADMPADGCDGFVMHAPPGTIERRHAMALALRTLKVGAPLTVVAANDKGGTRLADELTAFGCTVDADHRRHHRIARTVRPDRLDGLEDAIAAGAPRLLPDLGLWSQPGLFNWDRIDPGSKLLLERLPRLEGRGADLGCGIGVLARAVMAAGGCKAMALIDIDRRALDMAARNVTGDGVQTVWADVRQPAGLPASLDFVVMNPPFHDAGSEDKTLGTTFITRAAGMLRPGGKLWLVANRHLPYEAALTPLFDPIEPVAQASGFKVYAATRKRAAPRGRREQTTETLARKP